MTAVAELTLPAGIEPLFPPPLRERLVTLRRELHANPELSSQEEETARRLTVALSELAPNRLDRVAGTGVVARIRGRERGAPVVAVRGDRSEEHTSELQSRQYLVCRLLLEKKKT